MSDFDNTNRGVLFKNDKHGNDKRPDYKGSINIEGTDYWLSAWIKEGQKGKFVSLSVEPKDDETARERKAIQNEPRRQSTTKDDLDW